MLTGSYVPLSLPSYGATFFPKLRSSSGYGTLKMIISATFFPRLQRQDHHRCTNNVTDARPLAVAEQSLVLK